MRALNEANNEPIQPIEDGEVPEIPEPVHIQDPMAEALQLLNSSAAQLGFSHADIQRFLQMRLPVDETSAAPANIVVPIVRTYDPIAAKPVENSSFDLKTLKMNHFTTSTKASDVKERFKVLDSILLQNGLLSMANKTRAVPIITPDNPTGQSTDIITSADNIITIIKADNVHLWAHDMNRLHQIVHTAFDKSLHHISNGFETGDSILAYTDVHKFYFSQNNQGAKETRLALEAFKIKPATHSLRQDLVLFEDLRKASEYAVDTIFNDKQNNSYLDEKFEIDTRVGVVASLTSTNQSKWNYRQRLDALHQLQNCDIMPSVKDVPLKALVSKNKPKEICRNFSKGSCRYGEKCFNIHDKSSVQDSHHGKQHQERPQLQIQAAPPPVYNNNGVKKPVHVSARHRQVIGENAHKPSSSNISGLSRNQRVIVAALTAHEERQGTDSWIDQSHYHHTARDSNGHILHGMFTSSSSSAPSSRAQYDMNADLNRTQLPPSEQYSGEFNTLDLTPSRRPIPVIQEYEDEDEDESESDKKVRADQEAIIMVLLANSIVVRSDTNTLNSTAIMYINTIVDRFHTDSVYGAYDSNTFRKYIVYTRYGQGTGSAHAFERKDVSLFGWSSAYPLQQYDVHPGIRQGSPHLLELVTSIGSTFLKAVRYSADQHATLTPESYMTFSPLGHTYHPPNTPGSYVSSVQCLHDYKYYFDICGLVNTSAKTYMHLAIIYDFMAFTSQLYRNLLGRKVPSLRNMAVVRRFLRRSISDIMCITESQEYSDLLEIFRVICDTAMPNPCIHDPSFESPVASRSRQREPASLDVSKQALEDHAIKKPRIERLHTSVLPILYAEVPQPHRPAPVDLRSPEPISTPSFDRGDGETNTSSSEASTGDSSSTADTSLKYFSTISINAMSTSTTATKYVMDSGAGKCGTSDLTLLRDVQPCKDITISGAFGPSTMPTQAGKLGPLGLDTVHIEGMGSQTLVSLSQFCAGGNTGTKYIGVFTPTEYRMYDMLTALSILSDLATHGTEVERGSVQNGIYVRESS